MKAHKPRAQVKRRTDLGRRRKRGAPDKPPERHLVTLYQRTLQLAHEMGDEILDRVISGQDRGDEYYGALLVKNVLTFERVRLRA